MDELLQLHEIPTAKEIYMLVGWRQWADAGSISSGLPEYLIGQTDARKIGEIKPDSFYLFQLPGTHHFLRPEIKLEEGYRQSMSDTKNEFFYTGDEERGLVIFLGDEPHLNVDRYSAALLEAVETLRVKRVVAVAGVYGSMPYDKDREISCIYSLPRLKEELAEYAVKFSDYEGGTTIGGYLVHLAEAREIEWLVFYGFVPAYDFSQLAASLPGIRIENDFKAWYDLLNRFNHMLGLDLDLSDLAEKSEELLTSMETKIEELDQQVPQLNVREYLAKLAEEFTELSFVPLGDVWRRELDDIFEDLDE
jgi:proteasome assembly chaperone (PAC2) family protein